MVSSDQSNCSAFDRRPTSYESGSVDSASCCIIRISLHDVGATWLGDKKSNAQVIVAHEFFSRVLYV